MLDKNMLCVAVLAVTMCCWHHLERRQPQVDVCFHLVWLHTFWINTNTQRWHVVLPQKELDMLFHWKIMFCVVVFAAMVCFWHHFDRSQHQGNIFFNWSKLPSLLVQMNNLVWHVVLSSQHAVSLKNLVFCGDWQRQSGFGITLTEISTKLIYLKSCSLFSTTWIHMNKLIWHVSELLQIFKLPFN